MLLHLLLGLLIALASYALSEAAYQRGRRARVPADRAKALLFGP